ncbi:MAG: hypothetical protein M9908_06595 [Phyllobacteriaceae bacterium]|nr:hypothetical protein [Phyllobacteriaceae bacterium]
MPAVCNTKGVIGEAESTCCVPWHVPAGGANGLSISRQEAEILFDIGRRTDGTTIQRQDLFVRAAANYLMAVSSRNAPTRAEALARQEWLEDTDTDVTGFMGQVFSGLGGIFTEGFFDDVFTSAMYRWSVPGLKEPRFRGWRRAGQQADRRRRSASLIERIRRDGAVNANERAAELPESREPPHRPVGKA